MRKRKYAHSCEDKFTPDTLKEDIDNYWREICPQKVSRVSQKNSAHIVEDDEIPKAEIHNLVSTALLQSEILPLDLQLVSKLVCSIIFDYFSMFFNIFDYFLMFSNIFELSCFFSGCLPLT